MPSPSLNHTPKWCICTSFKYLHIQVDVNQHPQGLFCWGPLQPLFPKPIPWACCRTQHLVLGMLIQPASAHGSAPLSCARCRGLVDHRLWCTRLWSLASQCKRKCCTGNVEEALLQYAVRAHQQHCLRLESMAQRGCTQQKSPRLSHKDQLHTPSSCYVQSHTSQAVLCSTDYKAKQDSGVNTSFLKQPRAKLGRCGRQEMLTLSIWRIYSRSKA